MSPEPTPAIPCDHQWEKVDDSFSHEYGTERIIFERCELCGQERDYEPDDFDMYDDPQTH